MDALNVKINNIKNIVSANIEFPFDNGIYTIVGSNGCGKSTIMLCLAQLISHQLDRLTNSDIKNDSLGKFDVETEIYESMKQLNRFYENIKLRQQELKVNFREHLAVIYPNYKITDSNPNGAFKNVYSNESLGFLKEFPHPELVINKTVEEIEERLIKYLGKKQVASHLCWSVVIAVSIQILRHFVTKGMLPKITTAYIEIIKATEITQAVRALMSLLVFASFSFFVKFAMTL